MSEKEVSHIEVADDANSKPRRGRAYKIVKGIEESPYVRLVAIIGILIIPYQFWAGLKVNRATLVEISAAANERTYEARARNWGLLTETAPGNSGKVQALESLHCVCVCACAGLERYTNTHNITL